MLRGVPYKFNIVNLLKPDSTFNAGLRPLLYSKMEAEVNKGICWSHDGKDIYNF